MDSTGTISGNKLTAPAGEIQCKVYKYSVYLEPAPVQVFNIYPTGEILGTLKTEKNDQPNGFDVWVKENTSVPSVPLLVKAVWTGEEVNLTDVYIGTVKMEDGLVYHLFI